MKNIVFVTTILLIFLAACTPTGPSGDFSLDVDPCLAHELAQDRDYCYFELTDTQEAFACPLIKDETLRSLCYVEAVQFDPQEQYCEYVVENDVSSCFAELGIALRDYSYCDRAEGLSADYCEERVAELTSDNQRCAFLESDTWIDTCYDYFGRALSDKINCFKVKSPSLRDSCVYNVSMSTGDVELCKSIVNTEPGDFLETRYTTGQCITQHAKNTLEITVCDAHEDSFNQNLCRYRVVTRLEDVELCDKIKISVMRERCVERITNPDSVVNETFTTAD